MASARNAQRYAAERVPLEVLRDMLEKLEPPDPNRHAWERNTVVLPAVDLPSPADLTSQVHALSVVLQQLLITQSPLFYAEKGGSKEYWIVSLYR